jgi:hypothetical protein
VDTSLRILPLAMAAQLKEIPGLHPNPFTGRLCPLISLNSGSNRFCGFRLPYVWSSLANSPSPKVVSSRQRLKIAAVAEVGAAPSKKEVSVIIDNSQDSNFTVVTIEGYNRPGLLTSISGTFRDLGLDVAKVSMSGRS